MQLYIIIFFANKILGKKKACVFQTVGTSLPTPSFDSLPRPETASLPTPCPCIIIIIIDINPKGVVALLTLSAAEYKPKRCHGSSFIKCSSI